jgi:hypothetical protein
MRSAMTQSVEALPYNWMVAGSNPNRVTEIFRWLVKPSGRCIASCYTG